MKVYKLVVYVIDHNNVGAADIESCIEDSRYPNRCISPYVWSVESRDIGEWTDDSPLNKLNTRDAEFGRLFGDGE